MRKYGFYFIVVMCLSVFLISGGLWYRLFDNSGNPMKWKNSEIVWYSDDSDLTETITNDIAVGYVQHAFDSWANSTLVNEELKYIKAIGGLTITYGGSIGEEITVDNYTKYIQDNSELKTVVIFDKGGEILEDMGLDYYGLTPEPSLTEDEMYIARNIIIINGAAIDDGDVPEVAVQALITHEVGHLLNLDHSAVNFTIGEDCAGVEGCENANRIPTMYPFDPISNMALPKTDDIISLAYIYPSTEFESQFCTIKGEIKGSIDGGDGCGIQGVHVVARREETDMNLIDSRGMVSGVLYWPCEANGSYFLKGIVPGKQYKVFYEATPTFGEGSTFEPLGEYSPAIEGYTFITSGGEEIVSCSNGGDTIEMDSVTVDLSEYVCAESCHTDSGGSHGCSLRKSK